MKTIIVKFRSLTRYGVAVFLAVASCFSSFAECTFEWDDEAQGWWINCTFGDSDFIPADEIGGGGGCPDCTAMTPEECEDAKLTLQDEASMLSSKIQNSLDQNTIVEQQISQVRAIITELKDEGENFTCQTASGNPTRSMSQAALASPQANYFKSTTYATTALYGYNVGSQNAIYKYYNTLVGPDLDAMDEILLEMENAALGTENELNSLFDSVSVFESVADDMNCSACSGSSGGDSGGGTTPSGCPCSEVIEAVRAAVQNCYTKLEEIKKKLDDWNKLFKVWDQRLKWIADAMAPIGTNFNYAVEYRNLDGVEFQMKQLDKLLNQNKSTGFDFQEFGKLSWFSRVEYLLMSIAGVFSATNVTGVSESKLDEAYSALADKKETLQANVDGVESSFASLNNSFKSLCNSLKTGVGYGSSSPSLNLFPSWFGGRGLSVAFPSQVVSTARAVTSLFWSVLFACVLYEIILHGCLVFFDFFKFFVSSTSSVLS